jgi:hypothetical protein
MSAPPKAKNSRTLGRKGRGGVDVSAVAVEMNNKRFPHRQFKRLDFTNLASIQEVRSDVVLCMEVLIHQHCRESYEPVTNTLQRAGAKSVVIEARSLESDCLAFVSLRI